MTGPRGWGLPESHLLPDAIVALVDGELSAGAQDRALSHVARCPECAIEVKAQRQARTEIQFAQAPCMSAGFLASLRSIPQTASLAESAGGAAGGSLLHEHLAVTEDGQFVAIQRPERVAGLVDAFPASALSSSAPASVLSSGSVTSTPLGASAPLGSSAPLGTRASHPQYRRRVVQGAGVAVSGLVLTALAFTAGSGGGVGANSVVKEPADNQPKVLRAQFGLGSPVSDTASTSVSSSASSSVSSSTANSTASVSPTSSEASSSPAIPAKNVVSDDIAGQSHS